MKWLFALVAIFAGYSSATGKPPLRKSAIAMVSVFIGNDTTVACNKLLQLTALTNPTDAAVTYQWKMISASSPAGFTATSADKKTYGLNFSEAGVYVFSITVTETATGAEARDEITITANCGTNPPPPPPGGTSFKYTRSFSPNNDGINDIWELKGVSGNTNLVVCIYNQHGKEMLTVKSPVTDDIWDGTIKGKPMPVDTYYFVVWKDGKKILGDNLSLLR
jgi:gliding motility-associated-like protein